MTDSREADREFQRAAMLIGREGLARLSRARVAVFGIGGVGGYVAEALARSGLGAIDLIDGDTVTLTNINRQITALHSTIGLPKVEVMAGRLKDINPLVNVSSRRVYLTPENAGDFPFGEYDYIADAVDDVTAKVLLAVKARETGTPIISAMGAGDKLDPSLLKVADIYETRVCPLARVMRQRLRAAGIGHLKVVYSDEPPVRRENGAGENSPGSIAPVPAAAGLIMAAEIIKDIAAKEISDEI